MTTTENRVPAQIPQRTKLQEMVKKAISLAEEAGCQLRPMQSNPTVLRGLCPFHHANTMQNSNTLRLDTQRATFRCQFCGVDGTMVSFAAIMWEMSIPEALQIMNTDDIIAMERPTPICMREPELSEDVRFRAQNSHILTKATQYYSGKLAKSHEAMTFVTRLGITMAQTEMMKIGYTDGWGLINFLQQAGISQDEIATSTLITTDQKGQLTERYERVLTIPHLDTSGNTAWMMMVYPASPDLDEQWDEKPHRPIDLWGKRPYMLGSLSIRKNEPSICITDDPRVYLVTKALGISTLYTMGRTHLDNALKIAQKVAEREPHHLTIACQEPAIAEAIDNAYQKVGRPTTTRTLMSKEQVANALEPTTRSKECFAPPEIETETEKETETETEED